MAHLTDVTGSSTMAASDRSLDPGGDASVRPGLGKTATLLVWLVALADAGLILVSPIVRDTAVGGGSDPSIPEAVGAIALYGLTTLYGVVGAIIVTRQPRNAIGWMVWGAASVLAVGIFGAALAELRIAGALPVSLVAAPLSDSMLQVALYLITVFIPLYFPDGRLPSRRWWPVPWYATAGLGLFVISRIVLPGAVASTLVVVSNVVAATAFVLALAATVIRFRQGDRAQRQQIKWLAAAAALAAIGFATSLIPELGLGWILFLVGMALLPVAIGIAVLRYRLYEIDRIISRTLAWALVTGLLLAAFVVLVIGLTALLEPVTGGNTFAVAGSTLVVFVLFQPLRTRIQGAVDRRFDRYGYDAERTAAAFATRLRDDVDLASVQGDLLGVVAGNLQPTLLGIWMRGTTE